MTFQLLPREIIAGEIAAHRDTRAHLLSDLDHIDATIRIFDPAAEIDPDKLKRPPPMFAGFRGELSRFLLDTLRNDGPLSTLELTERVMHSRRIDTGDASARLLMMKRVGNALAKLAERYGLTSEPMKPNGMKRWGMVDSGAKRS